MKQKKKQHASMTMMGGMWRAVSFNRQPPVAAVLETLDSDDNDDGEEEKQVSESGNESSSGSEEETPPKRRTKKRIHRNSTWRKENGESFVNLLHAPTVPSRGMSKRELLRNQQVHVTQRIMPFVTSHVFCKIKFICNHTMLQQVMNSVLDHEKVQQQQRFQFQLVYESAFNESLNAKRSTCETAGRKIVVEKRCPYSRRNCSQWRSYASSGRRKPSMRRTLSFVLWNLLGLCGWKMTVGCLKAIQTDFRSNIGG